MLLKRKWLLLAILVVCFTLAAIRTFRERPMYQATAQIMIERETPNVIPIQQVMQISEDYTDFYNTQYKVLQSRALAVAVAERLRIWEHPEFGGRGEGGAAEVPVARGERALDAAAAAILGRIIDRAGEELLPRQREGEGLRPEARGPAGEHPRRAVHRAEPAAQGRHHPAGRRLPRRAVRGGPQEARGGRAGAAALQRGEQRHLAGGAPGRHDPEARVS